jgi:anti-sigma B factor antagonist
MEIQQEHINDVTVLHPRGRIDSGSTPQLSDSLQALISAGRKYLILNLSDVPYISSAGLRALTVALKAVRRPNVAGELVLTSLQRPVWHAFRISGFDQVFSIYETVPEALTVMGA